MKIKISIHFRTFNQKIDAQSVDALRLLVFSNESKINCQDNYDKWTILSKAQGATNLSGNKIAHHFNCDWSKKKKQPTTKLECVWNKIKWIHKLKNMNKKGSRVCFTQHIV